MKKLLFLSILFLIALATIFAQKTILENDGYDWFKMDQEQKYLFTLGFVSGSHSSIQILLNMKVIKVQDWMEVEWIYFNNSSVSDIINEVEEFYKQTKKLTYPIILVMYIRNDWKNNEILDWEDVELGGFK